MSLRNNLYYIVAQEEGRFTIRFDANHPIFQGHFPGHPVVPGACLIQIAEELAGTLAGRTVHFTSLRNVKFRQPVTPDTELTITINNDKIEIDPYMCASADVQ